VAERSAACVAERSAACVAERSAACVAERSAACVAERSAACVAERSGRAQLPASNQGAIGDRGRVIEEATEATPEVVEALERLVPQLSRSAEVPTAAEIGEITGSPATALLVARDDASGEIVGTLTLVLFRIPTGLRAWIEDVVVDEAAGRRGIGTALTEEALRRAVAAGARTVDLTSRPSREAANRLYRSVGFEARDTNVYRWTAS
jgi:ribosomal protein S18 acetylase RimI-like enzyme